jgi:hypothetical protein
VKDIRERAVAMQSYARQARDGQLIEYATDIRLRGQRRAGQLRAEMKETGERDAEVKGELSCGLPPNLVDLGVTKTQNSGWQKL